MISWFNRKQTSVVLSMAEVEYITLCSSSREAMWVKNLLVGLFDLELEVTYIWCENQSWVKSSENLVFHDNSKNIEIKYHYIIDIVKKGALKLQYVTTNQQIIDVLTKTLSRVKFVYFKDNIGVVHKDVPHKGE
jgi:hypothetical protein